MRKITFTLLISFFAILFYSCTDNAEKKDNNDNDNKEQNTVSWEGKYFFEEEVGEGDGAVIYEHNIIITKSGDTYKADFQVDGLQAMIRANCSGQEKDGKIIFTFDEFGAEHIGPAEYEAGSQVFVLSKSETGDFIIDIGTAYTATKK